MNRNRNVYIIFLDYSLSAAVGGHSRTYVVKKKEMISCRVGPWSICGRNSDFLPPW